jgi:MYXO-CTERM domain-containing protein
VPKSCGAYQCASGICPSKCFIDADCVTGLVCLASVCTVPVIPVDAGAEASTGGAPPQSVPDASTSGTGGTSGASQSDAGPDASNDASDDASGNPEAGAGGDPLVASQPPASTDKGSCGCRLPGTPSPRPLPLLLGLAIAGYAWRRRRTRAERSA